MAENKKNTSIIPIDSNALAKARDSIEITKKLLVEYNNRGNSLTKVKGKLKWKFKTDGGHKHPLAIKDDVVYFIGYESCELEGFSNLINLDNLYAIDMHSGELKWELLLNGNFSNLIVDDLVYIDNGKNLYVLNNQSPQIKWELDFEESAEAFPHVLAVKDGLVYASKWDFGYHVYAFDSQTRELKWKLKTEQEVDSAIIEDGVIYCKFYTQIDAVDIQTREMKWKFKKGNRFLSSPTIVNHVVYVGSGDKFLYAVDSRTGKLKWKFETEGRVLSPTIIDGVVYVGSHDKFLYAVDSQTGKLKWKFETGGWIECSPTVMDGVVYVGGHDKFLHAVDSTTGKLKWKFETESLVFSAEINNGVVYVGSRDGSLYAIELK
jgi:outer membrane protein assembly factor BamB